MQQEQVQPSSVFVAAPQVGPVPTILTCPACKASIRTQVRYEATFKTHMTALCLCLCFCWPCVCVPYCVNSCKNANHYCPQCSAYIGSYYS